MSEMTIQWYPGHMTKTRRMMEQDLKLVKKDGRWLIILSEAGTW